MQVPYMGYNNTSRGISRHRSAWDIDNCSGVGANAMAKVGKLKTSKVESYSNAQLSGKSLGGKSGRSNLGWTV